jgi:hypothetical protein
MLEKFLNSWALLGDLVGGVIVGVFDFCGVLG